MRNKNTPKWETKQQSSFNLPVMRANVGEKQKKSPHVSGLTDSLSLFMN